MFITVLTVPYYILDGRYCLFRSSNKFISSEGKEFLLKPKYSSEDKFLKVSGAKE
jgi:hypothetical protein